MRNLFYYAFDEKVFLHEVENKVVVSFEDKYLADLQQYFHTNDQILHVDLFYFNNGCTLTTKKSNIGALMADLKKQAGVKSVNPAYTTSDGCELGITDEIVLQFKHHIEGAFQHKIDELYKKYQIEVKKTTELFQILSVPVYIDSLEAANALHESGLTHYCYPDFVSKVKLNFIPTDTYFKNQYYLRSIGQTLDNGSAYICTTGADIRAETAWDIGKGFYGIVIAVVDTGVSSDHPDLPNSRQVRLNGSNFAGGNANDPSPVGNEAHGNACAGIIAASHNDEGIAGIAPLCRIMPVRLPSSGSVPGSVYASAITFARTNGAAIISNSWGFFSSNPNYEPVIVSAISDATSNGRGGLGCVVVFAAGNTADHAGSNSGFVTFPSNVLNPGVLTVGASDRNDYQANYSPTSNLGSSQNQIIDVMAPSSKSIYFGQIAAGDPDVWTIDIQGGAGYNPLVGALPTTGTNYLDYTGHFSGTSAACPQVAGVAALMLSENQNLTQAVVGTIIRSTARKARSGSSYTYSTTPGRPDGTFNDQMGYGVVNAYDSVRIARPLSYFTSPSQGINNGGQSTVYADSNGYASAVLFTTVPSMAVSYSFVWSSLFYGQYDRWYLWPSGNRADISVYLNPGQSGGTLRVVCDIYIGSDKVTSTYYYLDVLP